MVGLGRVELPTYGLGNRRSIHLSYSPVIRVRIVYIHLGERCRTFPIARYPAAAEHSPQFLAFKWTIRSNTGHVRERKEKLRPF
jgi:hypothetical protein